MNELKCLSEIKKKETFKRIYILLRRVIFALCIFRRFKVLRRLFFTMFFLSIIWFMHVSARLFFSFISRFVRFCSVHVRFMFFLSFYSILNAFYIILISTMIGYCIIVCRPHFDFIVLTNDHSSIHNRSPSVVAFFPHYSVSMQNHMNSECDPFLSIFTAYVRCV